MPNCTFCGIALSGKIKSREEASYCCDGCSVRAQELVRVYKKLDSAYEVTLDALVAALDIRERKTAEHSRRVSHYSMILAQELGIEGEQCRWVCRGALLHDIGKIGVPDAILLKKGPLDEAEWTIMRKHPEMGAQILEHVPFLSKAREVVLAHQERFDGSGYPIGLSGEEIPLGARIFAVADTLDALLSDRPYHRGLPFNAVMETIRAQSGSTLDPRMVSALIRTERQIQQVGIKLCVGSDVNLSRRHEGSDG